MGQYNQFCKKGHDKLVTGTLDNGRCKVCREEYRKARYEREKEKLKQQSRDWYSENKEEVLERLRLDRINNPEKYREKDKNQYWSNPEKKRTAARNYYQGHAEERKAYSREYYTRPGIKEEKSLYNHEYWHANKEKLKPKKAATRLVYKERAREVLRLWEEANKGYRAQYNKQYGQLPEVKARRREREKANRKINPERHLAKKTNRRKAEGKLSVQDIRDIYDMSDGICCLCLEKLSEGSSHLEHVVPITRNGTNWASNVLLAHGSCNISKRNKTPLEYLFNWPMVTERYDMSELVHADK